MNQKTALVAIKQERERQEKKWGTSHTADKGSCASTVMHPGIKAAVLTEECGEVARAVLEGDTDSLRKELVQVAAVAVAWLESLSDRGAP